MNKIISTLSKEELETHKNCHKDKFNNFINVYYLKEALTGSTSITREKAVELIQSIRKIDSGEEMDKNVKRRIKNRKLSVVKENDEDKLYADIDGNKLRVIVVEECFVAIYEVHSERAHVGQNLTADFVSQKYACIPFGAVKKFVKTCPICNL